MLLSMEKRLEARRSGCSLEGIGKVAREYE
jgi:hypothetical protein